MRETVMLVAGVTAFLAFFALPDDESPRWLSELFWSKAVSFGCGWLSYRLWRGGGKGVES